MAVTAAAQYLLLIIILRQSTEMPLKLMTATSFPAGPGLQAVLDTLPVAALQVEVQESYGKQAPQRISLDPPDPKALTDDASQHGGSSQMMRIALSVEPRLAYVQVRQSRFIVRSKMVSLNHPQSYPTAAQ